MIIRPYFDGDDDMDLARKQHEVYGSALNVIVSTCNHYARFARAVLEDARHSDWGRIDRFDHRTLEYAHDLLAASWRFRSNDRQARLPFVALDHPTRAESRWVSWLRREVEGWIDKPYFVRWVQLILANQNQPRGDVAEAELCLAIMSSYSDVPWDEKRICALEAKLDRART